MQSVLGIVLDQLTKEERAAWPEEERIYTQLHSPVGVDAICQVIEIIQAVLPRMKLRYARVLLRRKVELKEGRFVPILAQPAVPTPIAPVVQCIHCGAEFSSLRRFDRANAHPCGGVERAIWRDLNRAGLPGPCKVSPEFEKTKEA